MLEVNISHFCLVSLHFQ